MLILGYQKQLAPVSSGKDVCMFAPAIPGSELAMVLRYSQQLCHFDSCKQQSEWVS
jgi:hypothetical protein